LRKSIALHILAPGRIDDIGNNSIIRSVGRSAKAQICEGTDVNNQHQKKLISAWRNASGVLSLLVGPAAVRRAISTSILPYSKFQAKTICLPQSFNLACAGTQQMTCGRRSDHGREWQVFAQEKRG
jgi:hypothetical protein